MAYSFVQYTGNGSTTDFDIVFSDEPGIGSKPYLSSGHLDIYLGSGKQTSGYTIDESGATPKVVFSPAPSSGTIVKIQRVTPKTAGGRLVDFQDGSILTEADLDNAAIQNLYIAQEAQDVGVGGIAKSADNTAWNADSLRIETLGTAVSDSDAVTKGYVDGLALYGGGTTNPQVWKFTTTDATTSSFTLASPSPSSLRNEVFVVYVAGLVQAPSSNDGVTVRDYKVIESSGAYVLVFETGAFPSNTGNTNCPPDATEIYVQNFGTTRNVFDSPLTLSANGATETPVTLKGAVGQTAKLLEVKNSDGVTKASIDDDGDIVCTDVAATGNISATGLSGTTVTTTGTITAGDALSGTTASMSGTVDATGNITSAAHVKADRVYTTSNTDAEAGEIKGDSVTATGTVTGETAVISGNTGTGTLTTTGNATISGDATVTGDLTVNGTSTLQGIKGTHFAECLFSINSWSGAITYINQSDWINVSSVTKPTSTTTARVTFTTDAPHLHLNATRVIEVAGTYYDADDYLYPPQYGPRANVGYLDVFHNGTYHSGSQAVTVRVVVF